MKVKWKAELTAKRLKMYAPAPTPMPITLFTLQTDTYTSCVIFNICSVSSVLPTEKSCNSLKQSYRCSSVPSLIDVVESNSILMDQLDFVTHFSWVRTEDNISANSSMVGYWYLKSNKDRKWQLYKSMGI